MHRAQPVPRTKVGSYLVTHAYSNQSMIIAWKHRSEILQSETGTR